MHRNHLPPTSNTHSDDESQDEEKEQVVATDGNNEEEDSDEIEDDDDDMEEDAEEEEEEEDADDADDENEKEEEEEESFEKTTTPVPDAGLEDYVSDEDSDDNPSRFIIRANPKPTQPPKSSSKKRAASEEEEEEEEVQNHQKKKAKIVKEVNAAAAADADAEEDGVKKNVLLWNPEDELKILNGMIEFKKDTGMDPYSDIIPFHEFVKGSVDADADAVKLKDKIKRLREKYKKTSLKKETDVEEQLVFAKPHEAEAYELSKTIWGCVVGGGDGGNGDGANVGSKSYKGKGKTAVKGVEVGMTSGVTVPELGGGIVLALPVPNRDEVKKEVKVNGSSSASVKKGVRRTRKVTNMELNEAEVKVEEEEDYMAYLPVKEDDYVVKEGLKKVDKAKVKVLNEKFKSYELEVAQLFFERADMVHEQTKLILDALVR